MNFFRKLFGLTDATPSPAMPAPAAQSEPPPAASSQKPEAPKAPVPVRVFDAYGRERLISKEEWRRDFRELALKSAWNSPDQLHAIIASELADGFAADMLEPARRYADVAPDKARSAVLLGVTLYEMKHFDEAVNLFETHLRDHGDNAMVLVNYAKVLQKRGEKGGVDELLWRALQADPNLEHALMWATQNARDSEGATGVAGVLRKVAVLPGSWRAQVWLSRLALEDHDLGSAMALYRLALSKVNPPPADMLVQLSGDLGAHGNLAEMIELVLPRFNPGLHGLMVGSNLIKALMETDRVDDARAVLEGLYRQHVPDWKQLLDRWQSEIDDRVLRGDDSAQTGDFELQRAPLEGPIWAMEAEGFDQLLPAKSPTAPRIGILSPSFTFASIEEGGEVSVGREGREGIFGRSLALHLSEQLHLATTARGMAIFLRVAGGGGFVLASAPYAHEQAVSLGGTGAGACDYVVNPHIDATRQLWKITFQVIETRTGKVLHEAEGACIPGNPERTFRALAGILVKFATEQAGAAEQTPPSWAGPFTAASFVPQMHARTQTLDVVVAAFARDARSPGLMGERPIFDFLLFQAVEQQADPIPRLLLLTALARHRTTGSALHLEYGQRVRRLLAEFPQSNPAAPVIAAAVEAIFPRTT